MATINTNVNDGLMRYRDINQIVKITNAKNNKIVE